MRELDELLLSIRDDDATPGEDHGAFRLRDQLRDAAQLGCVGTWWSEVRAHAYGFVVERELGDRCLQILGQVDQHRARPSGAGHMKSLTNGRGDVVDPRD